MQIYMHPLEAQKAGLDAMIIAEIVEYLYRPILPHDSLSNSLTSLKAGRVDKFPFSGFVPLVHNAPPALRARPVTAIESYQKTGENVGLVPHRYSILTVHHPHGGSTYMKLQLRAIGSTLMPILTAELADDRSALIRPHDRRLAALEITTPGAHAARDGPSLDALAGLLDIIRKRAGRYDPRSRNCLWLADLVLFGSTMKFKDVWLGEGRVFPDWPMRKYLRGEIGVLAASAQCFLPEGAPGWMGIAYGALGHVFGGFDMQREVEDVVGKWQDYMDAAPCVDVASSA